MFNQIQADLPAEANRPNIVLLKKSTRKCFIVDVASPLCPTRTAVKEKEKIDNCTRN